jgi:hypothetical protein
VGLLGLDRCRQSNPGNRPGLIRCSSSATFSGKRRESELRPCHRHRRQRRRVKPSGGRPQPYGAHHVPSAEERRLHVRKQRALVGIVEEAAKVITRVAARQAEALEADEQKRFEELERELTLAGLHWEGRYLELMNEARLRIIDAEIRERMQEALRIEEEIMLLLLVSVL